jgi:hypothetical protein
MVFVFPRHCYCVAMFSKQIKANQRKAKQIITNQCKSKQLKVKQTKSQQSTGNQGIETDVSG